MVTFTVKTASSSTTDATSRTTASWAPTAGKAYIAIITNDKNAATPATPTASGNGITWVQETTAVYDGTTCRQTWFRGRAPASPTTEGTTFDFGGETQQNNTWTIVEVDGEDTSGADASGMIQQVKIQQNGTAASPTLTFNSATSAANSLLAALSRAATNAAVTGPTGWTDVAGIAVSTPGGYLRVSKLEGAADDDTDWGTLSSPVWAIIQVEIKAAGGSIENYDSGTGRGINRGINRGVA